MQGSSGFLLELSQSLKDNGPTHLVRGPFCPPPTSLRFTPFLASCTRISNSKDTDPIKRADRVRPVACGQSVVGCTVRPLMAQEVELNNTHRRSNLVAASGQVASAPEESESERVTPVPMSPHSKTSNPRASTSGGCPVMLRATINFHLYIRDLLHNFGFRYTHRTGGASLVPPFGVPGKTRCTVCDVTA